MDVQVLSALGVDPGEVVGGHGWCESIAIICSYFARASGCFFCISSNTATIVSACTDLGSRAITFSNSAVACGNCPVVA